MCLATLIMLMKLPTHHGKLVFLGGYVFFIDDARCWREANW